MSLPRLKVESSEFLRLDVIRFVAALCVVFHHWKSSLLLPGRVGLPGGSALPRLQFLELSVDIFFVISGVIIARVYAERVTDGRSYRQYLIRRIARIYPVHLLTLVLMAVLALKASALGLSILGDDTLASFFRNLFLVNAWWRFGLSFNIVAWSISVEWLCYLLFPAMLCLQQRKQRWTWIAACCMPIVLSLSPVRVGEGVFHFAIIRGLLGFYVGMGAQLHRAELRRFAIPGAVVPVLAALALGLSLAGVAYVHLYALALAIPLLAFVADLRGGASALVRNVAPLSQLTFSIYMWHVPFATILPLLLRRGMAPWAWNSLIGVGALVLLCFSYVSFVALEDPARSWISRFAGGRRRASAVEREGEQIAP
ncbi:Peptidoglycan/LPS O-acetylase OafA/YrhL, contains acyltransferase and SGNH-hydrolase domains [Bryocella elongata]|uniref:Peptidoglycan/LPS O-acetylase OafA/YrhL, contains acyltransferase and SGNH-hydrolase domains n=1 Tax=Bryocella elongata TaxID=863522 RepID=A0A1H6B6X2_9BACT|nr:acyltransferase [Bryocella elongata]SEG56558.1 Peptidoglycan/LPS O-acetylase OafA/YrhL, contains acyltransferase and SGNH-hydrolase domains [Bryocella elongata]